MTTGEKEAGRGRKGAGNMVIGDFHQEENSFPNEQKQGEQGKPWWGEEGPAKNNTLRCRHLKRR